MKVLPLRCAVNSEWQHSCCFFFLLHVKNATSFHQRMMSRKKKQWPLLGHIEHPATFSSSLKPFSHVSCLSVEFWASAFIPWCRSHIPGHSPALPVKTLQLLLCCSLCIDGCIRKCQAVLLVDFGWLTLRIATFDVLQIKRSLYPVILVQSFLLTFEVWI